MKPDDKDSSAKTDSTKDGEPSPIKEETAPAPSQQDPQPSTSSSFQNSPESLDSSTKDALFEVS